MRATESAELAADGLVRQVRADPVRRDELVPLLREDHPLHAGRSAGTTARVRAWLLVAFAEVGVPEGALPYIAEELDSGDEPVLVAAAARGALGLRGMDAPPAVVEAITTSLITALWNMAGRDDVVGFDEPVPSWPPEHPTTALQEVLAALRDLAPPGAVATRLAEFRTAKGELLSAAVRTSLDRTIADLTGGPACCSARRAAPPPETLPDAGPIPEGIEAEDQDGKRLDLAHFLSRAPTLLTFFYTRCGNPRKCSQTVSSLAALARELDALGLLGTVQVAAVTYDPGYDTAARLRRYGLDRSLSFGPSVRMLRTPDGYARLREHLELRVGHAGSVVNRHAVELFLLDDGRVARCWTRYLWDAAAVLPHIRDVVASHPPDRSRPTRCPALEVQGPTSGSTRWTTR